MTRRSVWCALRRSAWIVTRCGRESAAAAGWRGGEALEALVLRAPDQCVHVRIGVAGGAAKVGVERLGPKLRCGDRQRDVVPTRRLAATHPAGADFDALGEDPV